MKVVFNVGSRFDSSLSENYLLNGFADHLRPSRLPKAFGAHKVNKISPSLQNLIRRYLAKKEYKRLKIEAKSVEHQKKLNLGLENKIISLQQQLTGKH